MGFLFAQARHRDFFAGHSWANGIITAFADSKNQESTSEAVNGEKSHLRIPQN